MSVPLFKKLQAVIAQLAKFTVVGAFGTLVHYTILILLVEKAGIGAVVSSSAGAVAGAFVNYFLNYYITFRSNRRHSEAIIQFYIVAGTGFLLNAFLMWLTVDILEIHYLPAQLFTTGVVLLWNFWLNRTWTFRSKPLEPEHSDRISN